MRYNMWGTYFIVPKTLSCTIALFLHKGHGELVMWILFHFCHSDQLRKYLLRSLAWHTQSVPRHPRLIFWVTVITVLFFFYKFIWLFIVSPFLQFTMKVENVSALFTAVFPGPKSCLAQNRHAGYICRRRGRGQWERLRGTQAEAAIFPLSGRAEAHS